MTGGWQAGDRSFQPTARCRNHLLESPGPAGRGLFIPAYSAKPSDASESPGPAGRGLFIPAYSVMPQPPS